VAAAHRALIDQIVEEDEDLLARYLDEGVDPSPDELHLPFEKALRAGHLIPILFVSAKTGAGIPQLLDVLARLAPNPPKGNPPPFYRGEPGGPMEAFPGRSRPGKARAGARLQGGQRSLHRQGRRFPCSSGHDPEGLAALCR
jgi:elongation factor G